MSGEDDAHKTHYFLKRRKTSWIGTSLTSPFGQIKQEHLQNSFIPLFGGREDATDVAKRHEMYTKMWLEQRELMESIVYSAYDGLLTSLESYVAEPLQRDQKLPVAFALLGTNTANSLLVLSELSQQLERSTSIHLRVITLNSKNSGNIKTALREVNRQLLAQKAEADDDDVDDVFGDKEGRLAHDFEIAEDWCLHYMKSENSDVSSTKLRLVIIVQDADSFNTQVLNQIISVLHIYACSIPVKLVLGLSSSKVRDWINSNISSQLRLSIIGTKFKNQENKQLAYKVLERLFLDTRNSGPMLDSRLAAVILNRFERANSSLDSLMAEIKLCYLIFYYKLPLSVLIDPAFVPRELHIDSLRKLPSFKWHIEELVHDGAAKLVADLLESDESIKQLLETSRLQLVSYKTQVLRAIGIFQACLFQAPHTYLDMEIYKTILSGKLHSSALYRNLLEHVTALSEHQMKAVVVKLAGTELGEVGSDSDTKTLRQLLEEYTNKQNFNQPLQRKTFYEVWTLDGGFSERESVAPPQIEEAYENTMLRIVRPTLRRNLEDALGSPSIYLGNSSSDLPVATHLINVYRDAPVSINVYDFYCAFRQSIPKEAILKAMKEQLNREIALVKKGNQDCDGALATAIEAIEKDEKEWEKAAFSWFLHTCHEFVLLGLLKERSKVDFFEKGIWMGL